MGLELFIGRSGSGKSQHILEDIKKVQQNYPRQMIYYLSPEQTTFSVEYRLSADKDLSGTYNKFDNKRSEKHFCSFASVYCS